MVATTPRSTDHPDEIYFPAVKLRFNPREIGVVRNYRSASWMIKRGLSAGGRKINVIVKSEANVALGFGQAKTRPKPKPKFAAGSKAVMKESPKAVKKGNKTMTTIDSIRNGVGNASSLPGQ